MRGPHRRTRYSQDREDLCRLQRAPALVEVAGSAIASRARVVSAQRRLLTTIFCAHSVLDDE